MNSSKRNAQCHIRTYVCVYTVDVKCVVVVYIIFL